MSASVMDVRPAVVQHGAPALLVAWQNPETRRYRLLGRTVATDQGYEFGYFPNAVSAEDFRPIPGFSDVNRTYSSKVLFPLLSGRIMSNSRPDREEWLQKLDLKADAAPFEVLAHSFGKRVADTYEFFEEPSVDLVSGTLTFVVPVHGLRYMTSEALAHVDTSVAKGQILEAVAEPQNPKDSRAVGLWSGGHKVGFVPAPVLDYVDMIGAPGHFTARVIRKNPPSDGTHLRVIVELVWTQSQ
ncbi:HIRAN domain-containing protein [Pseudarthrobacter oxydans]|uniref:HIRAN domain-containing protein n=1 Tax=Pseudarthrobacter oxydans TaxID=1671 RepID=UPI00344C3A85